MATGPSRKFAAAICIGFDDPWLPYAFRAAYDSCERVYLFLSNRPWHGKQVDQEPTIQLLKAFPDPAQKLRVVHGAWLDQAHHRNYALATLRVDGFTDAVCIDPDEIYDPVELRAAIALAAAQPSDGTVYSIKWHTYWKTLRFRIDPPELFEPHLIVPTKGVEFSRGRNTTSTKVSSIPATTAQCHHLAYVRSDGFIKNKVESMAGHLTVAPDWFERVWKGWEQDHQMTNLHPVEPTRYQHAIEQPKERLPPILRRLR